MHKALKPLIDIQELDIKMIRLMRVRRQRQSELKQIEDLRTELQEQMQLKKDETTELSKQIASLEEKIQNLTDQYKKLEADQASVKKVEEFNALTQQMTSLEREKGALETQTSNLLDKKSSEEEVYKKIKSSFEASAINSQELENEIKESINKINEEGQRLQTQRKLLEQQADQHVLKIYERLLRNKKDRVIVLIENRTCSGCHIALTLQHENLVRKGKSLVFCEHCSRIHYWQESESVEGATVTTRRRRRRTVKT